MNSHSSGSLPARRRAHRLAIVVPCHNEEECLAATVKALRDLLHQLRAAQLVAEGSFLCLVDDGSRDRTWQLIHGFCAAHGDVRGIKLSRNFGHQGAVLAGMLECDADAVVTIDADLQDDERCIAQMMERYHAGAEIVLGVRNDRTSDSAFKRFTAEAYYRVLARLGVKVEFNHADYRLLSRRAVDALRTFSEANLFLRGIIPLLGFRTERVEYSRRARAQGESKYPLRKMVALAVNGITSFSVYPLRVVAVLGVAISLLAFVVGAWAVVIRFGVGGAVPGWASIVVPMFFLGGIQILCLGVIGEYVGKIYIEAKRRPRYFIEQVEKGEASSSTPVVRAVPRKDRAAMDLYEELAG